MIFYEANVMGAQGPIKTEPSLCSSLEENKGKNSHFKVRRLPLYAHLVMPHFFDSE